MKPASATRTQPDEPLTQDFRRNLLAGIKGWVADDARRYRLGAQFPQLAARLDQVLGAARVNPAILGVATRHVLSSEALIEVMEDRLHRPHATRPIGDEVLLSECAHRVAHKLKRFSERPQSEQRRIRDAYPEVNLRYVLRACKHGLLEWSLAVTVLEDSHEYDRLLDRLNQAGLLDD